MTQKKVHSSKTNASEPTLKDSQNVLTILGILVILLITYLAYRASGFEFVLLFLVGVLIGFALFHARFAFAAVYRQIVETGNTEMLRAHMFMLGTTTTLFALILMFDISAFSNTTEGALSPISIGLVIGAFIFGFGMEMGSGLAPASFYTAKGDRTALLCTLFGFLDRSCNWRLSLRFLE